MTREQRLVTLAALIFVLLCVLVFVRTASAVPPAPHLGHISERLFADVPAPRSAAITPGPSSGGGEPRDPGWLPTGASEHRAGAPLPARVAVPISAPAPLSADAAVRGAAQTPATADPSPAIRKEVPHDRDLHPASATVAVGTATWYADPASPGGYYAAVGSWRYGDTPYIVAVCTAIAGTSRCVTVHVLDHCFACRDGSPLIDLSPAAFRALGAPLSAGVVRVEVTRP